MRFLLDEMLSGQIAAQLTLGGIDTIAVQDEEDLRQLEDPDIFAAGQAQQRVLVTYNRNDFLAIHADHVRRGLTHQGVVIVNNHRFPQRQPATMGRVIKGLQAVPGLALGESFLHWLQ